MEILLELLFELFGQVLLELLAEALFGLGDAATGGRLRRVALFALAGAAGGAASFFIRPTVMITDALTRYASIAAFALIGGLFLAFVESRVRRGGPGSGAAGFLAGVVFSLAYVGMRRLLLG